MNKDRIIKLSTYNMDIAGKKSIEFVLESIRRQENENKKTLRVLDIGCGTGQLTKIIAMQCNCIITAIDIDKESLKIAEESLKDLGNVEFKQTQIEDFKAEGKYDLVIMTQVLDHINNPKKILQQCNLILNDEGQIIIGISNGYGIYELSKHIFPEFSYRILKKSSKMSKLKKTPYTCNHNSPHLHKFSIKDIRKLLAHTNFEIIEIEKMTFLLPAFPFCLLYYFTPNKIAILFERLDCHIASTLPISFSSNWYMSCKLQKDVKGYKVTENA
jgi:2-polyprenyl-3-methyl-5-hydroxy-6-metoxy-1,4-benzoquinol methylase